MKIVNLCRQDYANYMFTVTKAMKAAGMNVACFKLEEHPFNYKEEASLIAIGDIQNLDYDVIQVFHSDTEFIPLVRESALKIVYHTGTKYRNGWPVFNELFTGWQSVACMPEFVKHDNPRYLGIPLDVSQYTPDYGYKGRIAHYPSHDETKGTEVIESLGVEVSREKLPHPEHLQRVNECDVYVELYSPTLYGREYGNFGTSALEAAAMGKIVVSMYSKEYEKQYGKPPIWGIEDLEELAGMSSEELERHKYVSRKWAEKHSLENTGERLKEFLTKL